MNHEAAATELRELLAHHADPAFADSMQRYFPTPVPALGVGNRAVADLAYRWVGERPDLSPADRLAIAHTLVEQSKHHEETLAGFALLHRIAKRQLGGELLDRARTWLDLHVTNWAQCDDLCLKLLYPYFLGGLDQIPRTREWLDGGPWARRAANVAVVKFVRRRVGKEVYELPTAHVFDNCTALMSDEEFYVQKGVGWLLKVTAREHPDAVKEYLTTWHPRMRRDTFRYALEGMGADDRRALMALGGGARA
ncbi:DNA alkylation repair protein [Streptomyces sp. NPDC058092]|uniref:DNA alkylation repair protein n=1 Tax=Streptomyces sp. NPDC058092 TaxID=3346336 RepID=UPI0036F164DF